jgi:flagellin FlaB
MRQNKPSLKENDMGAIGIGAMIIFIALILVAAVASTIIIKTAEELQQRAETTGDDTRDEISGKIQLIGAFVSDDTGGGANTADEITLIVQMSAGSDTTLLTDISWLIVCDDGAGAAETNTGDFEGDATDLDGTAIPAASSIDSGVTFLVPIDTAASCTPTVGDDQELRILIDGGGETYAQLHYNSVGNGDTIV